MFHFITWNKERKKNVKEKSESCRSKTKGERKILAVAKKDKTSYKALRITFSFFWMRFPEIQPLFLSSLLIFADFCYQSSLCHEKRRMKNVWYEFAIRHLSREDADNCLVRWGLQSEKVSIEFNDPSATTANVIQFYDYCSSGNFFRLTFVNFLPESYANCIFFILHRLKFKMI